MTGITGGEAWQIQPSATPCCVGTPLSQTIHPPDFDLEQIQMDEFFALALDLWAF